MTGTTTFSCRLDLGFFGHLFICSSYFSLLAGTGPTTTRAATATTRRRSTATCPCSSRAAPWSSPASVCWSPTASLAKRCSTAYTDAALFAASVRRRVFPSFTCFPCAWSCNLMCVYGVLLIILREPCSVRDPIARAKRLPVTMFTCCDVLVQFTCVGSVRPTWTTAHVLRPCRPGWS